MTIRVIVVSAQSLFLDALARCLNSLAEFEIAGIVNGYDRLVDVTRRTRPNVAVIVAGASDGVELVADLQRHVPNCGVVLTMAAPTRATVRSAVDAGALSVVPKDARLGHLVSAIRGVAAGCLTLDPELLFQKKAGTPALSQREVDFLRLTASGASTTEIANGLHLASGTVRNIGSSLIKKFGARSRHDAARIAQELGYM